MQEISNFNKSEQVTFFYYLGRMKLLDSKLAEAYDHLLNSYRLSCGYKGSNAERIQRQILKYLIPSIIECGKFPPLKIMEQFPEYYQIAKSVKQGNLRLFKDQLSKYKRLLIKRGLYLQMEKIQLILIRNLFEKVMLIYQSTNPKNKNLISIELFQQALNFNRLVDVEDEIQTEEVQCIMANLIYIQYIRGYISQPSNKIVLSDKNPFPNIYSKVLEKKGFK